MTKITPTKVTFKGGGYVIAETQESLDVLIAAEDFEKTSIPSKQDTKDFRAHQAFMKTGQKYIDLIEDHVEGRPDIEERFRYDANDILNLMAFLMKGREPAKKRPTSVEVCSKEEFKQALERKPFEVLPGGADAT